MLARPHAASSGPIAPFAPASCANATVATSIAPNETPARAWTESSVRTPGPASAPARPRRTPATGVQVREAGVTANAAVPASSSAAEAASAAAADHVATAPTRTSGPRR